MLILGNGRLVTRDEKNPYLENGAVAIDGNTIVKVGSCEEVKAAYPDAEFIDAQEIGLHQLFEFQEDEHRLVLVVGQQFAPGYLSRSGIILKQGRFCRKFPSGNRLKL